MGPPEPLKTLNSCRKNAKARGIFKKDCLHTIVFEVFRQFFGFGLRLGRILALSQFEVFRGSMPCGLPTLRIFEVFSDGLVMFGDQFEVSS